MTREERAIQILEQRECCRECVVENCTCTECDEAFEMAIKALKQKPVIDKIRAEVEDYYPKPKNYAGKPKNLTYLSLNQVLQIIDKYKNHVLQIIDKYKTESEAEE